jgi:hypothetical protein
MVLLSFIRELCDRVFFHLLCIILLFLSAKAVYDAFFEMKKEKKKKLSGRQFSYSKSLRIIKVKW